jgi:isoprenylcysteine carboxyl methyltransferase (ICMT) family protein YpbQ
MNDTTQTSTQSKRSQQDRLVLLDGKELDATTLTTQRAARRARTQMAKVLLAALGIGLLAIFAASFWVSRNAAGDVGLAVFLLLAALLFAAVYFVNNYWQWRVLLVLDMRCPHCELPLAEEIRWTKRPGYACPHCGKEAIATARQLGDA